MTRRQQRESRSVHHPQILHPNDSRFRIHHSLRIARLPHRASRRGMKNGVQTLPDDLQELGVGLDGRAGEILGSDEHGRHGVRGVHLSDALVACEGDLDVCGVGEPVWVDEGGVGHVGGGDANIAAGQGCDEGDDAGGVVVAVVRGTGDEVVLVSKVPGDVQVFDLWPIRGETGQSGRSLVGEVSSSGGRDFLPCCNC